MFDYTSNIRSRKTIPCTPDMFDIATHATKVSQICAEIADYREKKLRGEMSREDFETKKSELKRQLPAFLFHAHYSDGHRSNASAVPSGLSIYDLDHINDPRGRWQEIAPLAKELGIVLAHVSPSGEGLRLVFILPNGMDLANGQKWLANKLGDKEFDEACKDLARCSFVVPADYILYIDKDQLFADQAPATLPLQGRDLCPPAPPTVKPSPADSMNGGLSSSQSGRAQGPTLQEGEENGAQPTQESLRIFDETIKAATLTLDNLNAVGTRHNSLVTILSMGLCRLMPKEQLKAVISVRMPEFSKEPDCSQLIDDFYSKYTDPSKPMSYKLRKIFTDSLHAGATNSDSSKKAGGSETAAPADDIDIDPDPIDVQSANSKNKLNQALGIQTSSPSGRLGEELTLGLKSLPHGLRESLENIPAGMQIPVLFAILPFAATYADGVTVRYCDGRTQQLALMSIIAGPQASGKSICKDVVDKWLAPMLASDAKARAIEDKWREARRRRKANEKAPEDPHAFIQFIPISTSMSNLLRRAKNAPGRCLCTFGEELDTFYKALMRGAWSVGSDFLRVCFDCGLFGQDFNSDNSESGVVRGRFNFSVLGTYGSLRKFFKGDSIENGLSSRIMIAEMPDNSFAPMPKFTESSPKADAAILEAVEKLKAAKGFIDTPRLRKAIDEWAEQKRLEAMASLDYVKDTYRKRAAVIGFRCGVIYRILEGKESKNCLRFATMIAEYVLTTQCRLFRERMNSEIKASELCERTTVNHNVFDELPAVFTRDDIKTFKGGDITSAGLKSIIFRWKRDGWIRKVGINKWQKEKRKDH